jgi:O-antigen ligase
MKEKSITILQIGLIWFAATLSFQLKWLPTALGMMLAGLGWVLLLRHQKLKITPALFLPIVLYLLLLAGLPGAENTKKANQLMGMSIPLLVFPLLFAFKQSQRMASLLMYIFIYTTLVSAVVSLGYLSYMLMYGPADFTYRNYSPFSQIPSHYIAMYFAFAGGYLVLHAPKTFKPNTNTLLGGFVLAVALLMNARIQFLVIGIILIWWIKVWVSHYPKRGAWVLSMVVGLVVLFFSFPENRRRLQETKDELRNLANIDHSKQRNHRFYLWDHAFEVIAEKPLTGVGTGDANDYLREAYQKSDAQFWDGEGLYYLRDVGYNYHNQFLQSWAQNGLPALLALLAMFVMLLRKRDTAARLLALVLFFSMLTESLLERQAGLFFVSFMYCLVMFLPGREVSMQESRIFSKGQTLV